MKKQKIIASGLTAALLAGMLYAPVNAGIISKNMEISARSMAAQKTDVQTEGDYQYTVSNGEATIVKYTGSEADVAIPATLGGAPVTVIGKEAFEHNYAMHSVRFPDTVLEIEEYAFAGDTKLQDVVLPPKIRQIGFWAFGNTGLKEVALPDAPVSLNGSFQDCYSLKTVICSDSTEEFHLNDFSSNRTLQTIRLGKNTKLIDMEGFRKEPSDAFSPVEGTMQPVIEVPDDSLYFKEVGDAVYTKDGTELVFYSPRAERPDCRVLAGTKKIGPYAFEGCGNISAVALPNTLETLENSALSGCNLTAVNLPASLKVVKSRNFHSVKTVTVEGKNTAFEEGAFDINKATALCAKNSKAAKYFKKKNTKAKRIIYTLNGGVNHADNAYYFTKTRSLKTPYREGYRFVGWYTDKACTKKVIKATKGKSLHVYAKWAKL